MQIALFLVALVAYLAGLVGALVIAWGANKRWPTALFSGGLLLMIVEIIVQPPIQPASTGLSSLIPSSVRTTQ